MDYTSYGPGILAFLVVAALGLALFFLIKSMNRQFAKIQKPQDGHGDDAVKHDPDKPDTSGTAST